jgi:[protein-PII] uridylyltransferase
LIDSLYQSAYYLLSEPLHQQHVDTVEENKQQAKACIPDTIASEKIVDIWKNFNADYFLNYSPAQLAEHAKLMADNKNTSIIHIHTHASKKATEIFIYTPHHSKLFFAVTSVLATMQLSIVAAQMHITRNNYNLSTYIVLQRGNKPLDDQQHIERVQMRLYKQLQSLNKITPPTLQPLSPRLQTFNYPTTLEIEQDEPANCTLLRLFTVDRPGLLANIAQIFYQANIQVLRTKINTLAERAEDNFWLVNNQQFPLSPTQQTALLNSVQQLLKR